MSNKNNQKKKKQVSREDLPAGAVVMKFPKDMYYKNYTDVHFEKDKEYVIEAQDITRWLKRGGQIVSGELPVAEEVETPQEDVVPSSTVDVQPEQPVQGEDSPSADVVVDENKTV